MADTTPTSGQLIVRIVTPDRVLIDTTADAVELPALSGYMEALYGAAPLLAELGAGEVRLHGGQSADAKFFVAWGFVEVLPERVTILAETAMKPQEINAAQAQQDLAKAQEDWNQAGDDSEKYEYARAEIRVAEEKIAAANDR
ncbi:ATP synthase F1 subunit epsilon [Terriglobus aquaticus]|uniref:ATP synthase epsilon chain n=1 Tax=Terriglobus aquaticus TaxID=940139 RepID=A0ABW9KGV2_9BACT|nr:ATP synthase F1 subunit epsilon [Terriglobus aquaticus]